MIPELKKIKNHIYHFKILIPLVLLSLFFNACDNVSPTKTDIQKQLDSIAHENSLGSALSTLRNETYEDTVVDVVFHEFSVSINRLLIYDEHNLLDDIQEADTVNIYAELGETVEGQTIFISKNSLADVLVEMRYETSVTISGDGPHHDLYDWKHYDSDWQELKAVNQGEFICNSYSEEEATKFPEIQIKELQEKVKEDAGDEWYKLVSTISSPNQYPSSVSISRYFIRITGKRKDNEQAVSKLIIITIPMGC